MKKAKYRELASSLRELAQTRGIFQLFFQSFSMLTARDTRENSKKNISKTLAEEATSIGVGRIPLWYMANRFGSR